ncbi:MurR/RpiR family transcriptional regulator [Komagataeibacter sp. FNDCR2]|uniref:MurR/RpiR family transcriptional regulator n=1 Tax=Komagataeibacter sp. FNDCR2 TaxID=2878682 RepID=UPI001E5B0695|nr:MurR/RpiR family transcriptional regulator [Komagataeibacter sp. FNDCR2]
MTEHKPPATYEELIRVIHDRYDQMSRSYQKIAVYITQNPNDVAIVSVHAAGEKCGVHASGCVRFAQSLGYRGFRELQAVFRRRLSPVALGPNAHMQALGDEPDSRDGHGEMHFLRELILRDTSSLQELLVNVSEEQVTEAVDLMEKADTIYLIGQLRSAPVTELLRYTLTMLGKRTALLDVAGGLATHMARTIRPDDLLFVVSFRFYADEIVNIVGETAGRDIPVVAISDSTLSPVAKNARVIFAVPEHEYTFSRSLAAPMCLAQALIIALASRLQNKSRKPRIPVVTQKQGGRDGPA